MSFLIFFGLAATATVPVEAPAPPPAVENPAKPPAEKLAADANNDSDKKICRRSAPTGSRIPTKSICLTAKEWDEVGQKTRQALHQQFRTGANREF